MVRFEKKHVRSFVVILSLAVLVVIGSTVAYFSSKDESSNRFVVGRFDITLTETRWDPDSGKDVVPGDELEKNPQVTNNESINGYIFLRVTVPCDTQMVDRDDGTPLGTASTSVPMYKFMVKDGDNYLVDSTFTAAQEVHSHWHLVPGYPKRNVAEAQYVYVYSYSDGSALTPLLEGETTGPLFDKLQLWNFNESFNPEQSHSVLVEALGVQANLPGYTANQIAEIWSILDGGEGS